MKFQEQIGKWHRSTFGNQNIGRRLLAKFREESSEFLSCPLPDEAADCVIVLFAYADRQGFDLMKAVEAKFKIVKARGSTQIERDKERGIE